MAPTATAVGAADEEEILVAVPERVFNYEGRERVFYKTRDGDTLEDIADATGVRPDDLVEWNSLDPAAKLHPRMVLQIFVRKDFDPTRIVLLDPASVRVVTLGSEEFLELDTARRGKKRLIIEAKAGDTLARLGRRYGLTVGDLARINRFSHNTELQGGQKVVVYSPSGEGPREIARGMAPDPRRDRGGEGAAARDKVDRVVEKSGSGKSGRTVRAGEATAARAGSGTKATGGTGSARASLRQAVASTSGDRDKGDEKLKAKTPSGKAAANTSPKPASKKK